jgi:iron complex transport system ATP-binding protein
MRQAKPPILSIENLRIQRGTTTILDGISWRIERGQHWVIIGANGSGKTSLLSALTAYVTPTHGTIELLGKRYGQSDWRELRKSLGIVSSAVRQMMSDDESALESIISGKDAMIGFWGRAAKSDRAAAQRILRQIECEHLAARPWRVLSQGERQRVLIGRALMAKPRLLILDEPCAGLDPVAREHFLQFIERLGRRRNAPALVLVTHHVEEITPVFTHVLLLKDGRVLAAGAKMETLTSKLLTRAFETPIHVAIADQRCALQIHSSTKRVV